MFWPDSHPMLGEITTLSLSGIVICYCCSSLLIFVNAILIQHLANFCKSCVISVPWNTKIITHMT